MGTDTSRGVYSHIEELFIYLDYYLVLYICTTLTISLQYLQIPDALYTLYIEQRTYGQ